jgi:hypothetical protein
MPIVLDAPATELRTIQQVVNYMDRSDLSIAAPLMRKQSAISPLDLGVLLAAFF